MNISGRASTSKIFLISDHGEKNAKLRSCRFLAILFPHVFLFFPSASVAVSRAGCTHPWAHGARRRVNEHREKSLISLLICQSCGETDAPIACMSAAKLVLCATARARNRNKANNHKSEPRRPLQNTHARGPRANIERAAA